MRIEKAKSELIDRLSQMKSEETISALLYYKKANEAEDWASELTAKQKAAIEEGLEDEKAGRLTPSSEVWKKYGR